METQLQAIYFDLFGENDENRRYEKRRAMVSYVTNLLLVYTWYRFCCGPIAFFLLFVPASLVGFFHLVHFNWSTHNAFSPVQDFKPVNLDHGFYRIGNKIWFGIYFHGNHHKKTNLFNPGTMPREQWLPITPSAKVQARLLAEERATNRQAA